MVEEIKEDRKEHWANFKSSIRWSLVILIGILTSILGILYYGQTGNAEKIVKATMQHSQEMKEISKDLNELKVIVTRIEERTKRGDNHDSTRR